MESFGRFTPHPRTEGVDGISGTVQDYLDQQQLAPFFEMSERYGSSRLRLPRGKCGLCETLRR
jgi:hypothetical protein